MIRNINLNVGGVFGALVGGGAVVAIVLLAGGPPASLAKLGMLGLAGGALAGNFLWARFFNPPLPPGPGF
jgi:hypothetical protein